MAPLCLKLGERPIETALPRGVVSAGSDITPTDGVHVLPAAGYDCGRAGNDPIRPLHNVDLFFVRQEGETLPASFLNEGSIVMPTSIVTWNSRGNPINNVAKRNELDGLLVANDFVLLQEAGDLASEITYSTLAGAQYRVIGVPQAGAFNPRCGTAILTISTRNILGFGYRSLMSSNGRFGIFAIDGLSRTLIGTLHANSARNAAADRTGFLQYLYKKYINAFDMVIGADFNIPPLANPLNVGTRKREQNWDVHAVGVDTHFGNPRNSELDYFVTSVRPQGIGVAPRRVQPIGMLGLAVDPLAPPANGSAGSDHKWVRFIF